MEDTEKAFKDIKELLKSPPLLKASISDSLFQLESDTSSEGVGSTLFQKQGDEWVVIGYHSKRLPTSAKNFGVTELELTGLLVNIHRFMQLLCNQYFEVLVITCDQTNFTIVTPLRSRDAQSVAEALIYRVIYLFGPPRQITCDEATEFASHIVQAIPVTHREYYNLLLARAQMVGRL